jgi:dTDP-4-dehydrorhamnose reductase
MKKMNLLILGSSGLIGHQVLNYFKNINNYEIFNISYNRKADENTILFDLRNYQDLKLLIDNIKPDFIINCAGILIEASNKDPQSSILLNAYLPNYLSTLALEFNFKLIHISTDCVFTGEKGSYEEKDEKDGISIYSKTKSLGEVIDQHNLTIRTSVVGPELKIESEELFNWYMFQVGNINGYTKSIWSGVTTTFLPKAIENLINNKVVGLYHVTNNKPISKYDLLNLFKKYSNKKDEINKINGYISDKSLIDTRKIITIEVPSYEIMIREMFEHIKKNKRFYQHYNLYYD